MIVIRYQPFYLLRPLPMKALLTFLTVGAIAAVGLAPAAIADEKNSAIHLIDASGSGAIEVDNPLIPDFEQTREDTLNQLNTQFQQPLPAEEDSFPLGGLSEVLDVLNFSSTEEPNSRGTQSVGVRLGSF